MGRKKHLTLGQLFTEAEINKAIKIIQANAGNVHLDLMAICNTALPRINKLVGQENSADYLAYALEYIAKHAGEPKAHKFAGSKMQQRLRPEFLKARPWPRNQSALSVELPTKKSRS